VRKFTEVAQRVVDANMHLVRIWGLFWPLVQFIAGLGFVVVLGYGGRLVISGDISLGDFVAFGGYLGMATWPMMAIGWVVNTLQRGMASMDRLNVIFSTRPEVEDSTDLAPVSRLEGEIEFRGLLFAYPGQDRPALRNIDLRIPAGRTLGILGRTGSGKTTLVSLLLRLYNPGPGQLLIDGVDINKIPLAVLRRDIGYVPQDNFLFSSSVRENIGFASDDFSPEEIEKAAEIAGVADDVRGFPEGFGTIVGERGVTLAGGQKQRIAIARAIVKNPRILILDAKTGAEVSAFDIPNAQLPDEIIDGGGQGERLLSAVEYEEDAISRIAYYGLENGALRHSVSLREALPGRRVKDVHHYGEGLAALCDDGSVSLLTPTGQILWTAKLKGAGPDGVLPNVVFSTPEGLLVVEYLPGLTATSSSVSALDSGGDTVFHVDGLRGVTRAGSTPRVFALGDSGIAGQDSLYVFDLAAGSAKTSRAVLQAVESYVVSPSGKYLLAQHRSSTGELKVAMYRLEE